MIYLKIFFTILIVFVLKFLLFDNLKENTINLAETIELNFKLFLINNAGLIYLDSFFIKVMLFFSKDPLLVKFYRKLNRKYGKWSYGEILTNTRNILVFCPDLSEKILEDSPFFFDAGLTKRNFFLKIMPNNLGISKCDIGQKTCPWKKRRVFNEKSLGFDEMTPFFKDIVDIVNNNFNNVPRNPNEWKLLSQTITSFIMTGDNKQETINYLDKFIYLGYKGKLTPEFKKEFYNYMDKCAKECGDNNLLHYSKIFKNDKMEIIHDQLPHWFAPFCFMINFLIPNLLCILLNFKEIKNRIIKEINCDKFNIFSKKTYLHYCVIEHIRLFNTNNINIQRTCKTDMTYNGLKMKKGDQIFLLLSNILRNKNKFNKPDDYIPNRWEQLCPTKQNIVFGVGPQKCPSMNISPILYKAIIVKVFKTFKNIECKYPILKNRTLFFINPYDIKLIS